MEFITIFNIECVCVWFKGSILRPLCRFLLVTHQGAEEISPIHIVRIAEL